MKPKKIGLFFGTYNPIHVGHLIIANHFAEFSDLEEVWLVVTPHNPHKKRNTLLEDTHRLAMVRIAVEDYPKLEASTIEFNLPQPNFTVNTLAVLEEKYPEHSFSLIMGEDNLRNLHKWKNYEVILDRHPIYVYPRAAKDPIDKTIHSPFDGSRGVLKIAAPIIQISATFIRKNIASGKNIRPLLPQNVWEYLDEMNFYK
jgi:nicotinate-nucleotide adenylyltransferase